MSAAGTKTDDGSPRRRRRPRAQTRALLLDTAATLVMEQLVASGEVGNLLAAVRVTDVLAAINEQAGPGEFSMTTGAVYQIWSSQEAFQTDLLGHVMYQAANRDIGDFRDQITAAMRAGQSFDEAVLLAGETLLTSHGGAPEISLAIGLAALASPQRVRAAEEESNADYLRELGDLLLELLGYGRRELASGFDARDLVWAVEALADGVDLRMRSHPEMVDHRDAEGHTAAARAFLGVITSMSVAQRH